MNASSLVCEHIARAARTLWSRGSWLGGALVSALCLCCFLAHRFLYGIVVVLLFVCLLYRGHTNPLVIQCYHLFSYIADAYELISWSPAVFFLFWFLFCVVFLCLVLWCVLFVCLFVCLFCCFRCLLSVLHGDSSMDYVSIQFSSLSNAHCLQDWCCHWSNSVNLQNAIVFPAW